MKEFNICLLPGDGIGCEVVNEAKKVLSAVEKKFGLISSSGQIEGTVTIKNEYGEYLKFNDLVVSIFDANNKEIDYTNLNNDGTFSFSSLAPGKYQVKIVDELLELLKIEPTEESKNFIVEIPCKYEDFVTVDNVNLEYVYKL